MRYFEKKLELKCSLEALYGFHTDVGNLLKLSPAGTKVELLDPILQPKEGSRFRLRVVKNFIPMIWGIEIQTMQKPHLLVDIATKSPFAFWRHTHKFEQLGNGHCLLTDTVEYVLPFGFLGRAFDFFVQKELENLFRHRHNVTQQILEEK